jgi:predicted nucleic acid-binding Zn ribbon protein
MVKSLEQRLREAEGNRDAARRGPKNQMARGVPGKLDVMARISMSSPADVTRLDVTFQTLRAPLTLRHQVAQLKDERR